MREFLLAVVVYTLLTSFALAETSTTPPTCPQVLKSCSVLVDKQDALIAQLNANQKVLEDNLKAQKAPLVPSWLLIGGTFVLGIAASRLLLK